MTTRRLERVLLHGGGLASQPFDVTVPPTEKWTLREFIYTVSGGNPTFLIIECTAGPNGYPNWFETVGIVYYTEEFPNPGQSVRQVMNTIIDPEDELSIRFAGVAASFSFSLSAIVLTPV